MYLIKNESGRYYNTSTRKFHTLVSGSHQEFKTKRGAERAAAKCPCSVEVVSALVPSSITRRTGTEGPEHDPYSYEELTVTTQLRGTVRVHIGLAEWLECDGCVLSEREYSTRVNLSGSELAAAFKRATGLTIMQAQRALRKCEEARYRAHRMHGGIEWGHGYPGEELCFCKCGAVVDSTFNESAII